TIMVVDDSETIRAVVERTLSMTRLPIEEVLHAENGRQALEKLAHQWVDIVFTDINMPEIDGVKLVDTMNANPEMREIPVVIVSTEGSKTRIEELRRKGVKGYLHKPFTPEAIRDVILETLGGWDE
ncbi:MAG: response regulator, partial [Chitinivibrionales bacterium]|nr:response regulator [Chitinivibrionales bacterium]MBD3396363.1 response regulator [Chitinivibrionales bacterium]